MKSKMVISTAVAPIHKEAGFTSEMVTQGLMWEPVTIVNKQDYWCRIKMEDRYEGWIHNFYLAETNNVSINSLIITNRYAPILSHRGKDANILSLLSFGTIVPILDKISGYCVIQLINGEEGFVPAQENVISKNRHDIINLARSLMGTPYLWGGKSSFGFDCSGFVEMVLKTVGISFSRDTGDQIKTDWLEEISNSETLPGDLVFFSENNHINHVAFIAGDGKIIHCSGEVKLESIIEGESGFNSKLAQLNHTFTSVSKMVNS